MVRAERNTALLLLLVAATLTMWSTVQAAVSDTADPGSCVIARFSGRATTYNPQCERESWNLSTGGRYNPQGWEAALQLDIARKYNCGYKNRCYAVVENTSNRRAAILLINDNGPLYSGSYGNKGVVIDLNEASMRYLANDPAGARFGNCKGVIPQVNVAILCRLIGQPGPLNEQDRLAWGKITSGIPTTQLPTNILSQTPGGYPSSGLSQGGMYGQQGLTAATTPTPASSAYPLPQPITLASIFATSSMDATGGEQQRPQVVTDLLRALMAPTSSAGVVIVRSPFSLSEGVGPAHATGLTSGSTQGSPTDAGVRANNPPQGASTFGASYQSPDLRWSAPTLFQPFLRDVEAMVRSIIELLRRL